MGYIGGDPNRTALPVASGDLSASIIADHSNIGAAPAETDELLLSDAGVLKAITVDKLLDPAGYTNIGAEPAGSDEVLLSDAGVLKAVTVSNLIAGAGGGIFSSYAIVADVQADDTNGGSSTSGSWQTRTLNTEITDPDGIVSLDSNQFTLASAGTYLIEFYAYARGQYRCQSRLYDITGDAELQAGTVNYGNYTHSDGFSTGAYRHTIAGSNVYEIQTQVQTSQADNGYGTKFSTTTNSSQIYVLAWIYKE